MITIYADGTPFNIENATLQEAHGTDVGGLRVYKLTTGEKVYMKAYNGAQKWWPYLGAPIAIRKELLAFRERKLDIKPGKGAKKPADKKEEQSA